MTRGVDGNEFGVVQKAKSKTVDGLSEPPPVVLFWEKERNFFPEELSVVPFKLKAL